MNFIIYIHLNLPVIPYQRTQKGHNADVMSFKQELFIIFRLAIHKTSSLYSFHFRLLNSTLTVRTKSSNDPITRACFSKLPIWAIEPGYHFYEFF